VNRVILGVLALVFSFNAAASVVFSPGLSYTSSNTEDSAATSVESSSFRADVRLGYIFDMGLYVGAMYQVDSTNDDITDPTSYNVGPTLGYYHSKGFYGLVTYHLIGDSKNVLVDGDKYTDAQGPQVDIGWVFPLASSFYIGPQVTWKQIKYGNYEDAAEVASAADRTVSEIRPYLSLWFMF